MFPDTRMRRIRSNSTLRYMTMENRLSLDCLVQPIFIDANIHEPRDIKCLYGIKAWPLTHLADYVRGLYDMGIKAVLLFGVPSSKDAEGTQAYDENGIIQKAIRIIKDSCPIVVMADLCLCEYTDHGHCGILNNGNLDNDLTLRVLVRIATSYAREGVDMVAPSGMIDGYISAIRRGLDEDGYSHVPIMSYAAKYESALYGPFREAACSSPSFGDRSTYQLPVSNSREALREIDLDIEEGADIIMIKPALSSLDIIRECRVRTLTPIAAYQVSGEYSMIICAGENGLIDSHRVLCETLLAIKRAGADIIVTYYAEQYAHRIKEGIK